MIPFIVLIFVIQIYIVLPCYLLRKNKNLFILKAFFFPKKIDLFCLIVILK